jgi:hypothetical protein
MSERRPQTESELIDRLRSIDARAPEDLHRRIEALVSERGGRASIHRRRLAGLRWQLAGALALVAVVAILVIGFASGGGSSKLTMRETLALTERPATMSAPAEDPHNGTQLAVAVDGVAFPYWGERFGWRSTGSRTDHIGGREITTVFYADRRGQRVGYAIVAGTPAPALTGGVVEWRGGTAYRLLDQGASQVVSWQRDGHLCVVAGRGVDSATLLALASWQGHDTLNA